MSKKLKVGVDVSCLTGNVNGIARYLTENLKYFERKDVDWYFYSHKNIKVDHKLQTKNITFRIPKYFPKRGGKIFWNIFVIPIFLYRDKLNIFWCPSPRVPMVISKYTKVVCTIHDLTFKRFPETMSRLTYFSDSFFFNRSLLRSDIIIAISDFTKNEIKSFYPAIYSKVKVIKEGSFIGRQLTTDEEINLDKKLNKFKGAILAVGTLEPRKNYINVLNAYAKLPLRLRQAHPLVIVGKIGWGLADLNKKTKELDITQTTHILMDITDLELSWLYKISEALCQASLYEGFGLPIVEAMSSKIPLVLSDIEVFREIAGEAAIYFDPMNPDEIYSSILRVITDETLKKKLISKGQEQIKSFSWKANAKKLCDLICRLSELENDA